MRRDHSNLTILSLLCIVASACQGTVARSSGPKSIGDASQTAIAYDQFETISFCDRLNFYDFVDPDGSDGVGPSIEERIAQIDGRDMVPIVERGRPLGPRITPRRVVHPDKGVVFGRVGDGQGEPFGFSTDAELVVTDVVRTADLRVLDALFATDPAESLRPCQRGACLIEPNSAWGYPMWIAVRVVDGHEYLAGWFPDFDPDPDGLRVPVLFDKWIAEIEAQWGVATTP